MAHWARLYVKLKTDGGTFARIGQAVEYTDAAAASVDFIDDLICYPDPRATEFRIYVSSTSSTEGFKLFKTYDAIASAVNNLAYAEEPSSLDFTQDLSAADDMPDLEGTNSQLDRDPNRIWLSDTAQPRSIQASRTGRAGNGPTDGVVAFAANTEPVSEGQFGTYPVYALCSESVSAGSLGQGDVAITAWNVIGQKGCIGRHAVANVDSQVFFASTDGIHLLERGLDGGPVSRPVHNASTVKDFHDCMGRDTSLAWYNDEVRGRRELWVSAGSLTFGLAYDYGLLFILDRARQDYARLSSQLFGASKEGSADTAEGAEGLCMDERGSTKAVSIYLQTAPLDLEAEGYWKRLYALWVRQPTPAYALAWRIMERDLENGPIVLASGTIQRGGSDTALLPKGLVREPSLELSAFMQPGQSVSAFGFTYQPRFTHREPRLSMPSGDGASTFQDVLAEELAWNCVEGYEDAEFINTPPIWVESEDLIYGVATNNAPDWEQKESLNYVP